MFKKFSSTLSETSKKYLIMNQIISNFVLRLLETKTGRLIITFVVLMQVVFILGNFHIILLFSLFGFLSFITLYYICTTTKVSILFKKIFKYSPLSLFKLSFYNIIYILYLIVAWFCIVFTSLGYVGILYLYAIPLFFALALFTVIVSLINMKKGFKYIKINKTFMLAVLAAQVLLMIFNFRQPYSGTATPFMQFGNNLAVFILPTYFILLICFSIITPFKTVNKAERL